VKVYLADLVHGISLARQQFVVPLNIANVGAYIKKVFEDDVNLSLYKYPAELISDIDSRRPVVLGLSLYAWNADLNRKVGQYIKKYYPDVLIVMGGPSMRQSLKDIEDFLRCNKWLDAYVMYEGERPFADLLNYILEKGPRLNNPGNDDIKNVAYLTGDNFNCNLNSDFGDLKELPSPYLAGLLDKFLEDGLIPLFETNRGCPFSCTFCTWGLASLNKVRKFPIERVSAELDYVSGKFPNLPEWIFADANFGMLERDIEIAQIIRKIRKRTPGLKEIMTWDAKNKQDRTSKIAEILERHTSSKYYTDIDMVTLAVQNLSKTVLNNIGRENIHLKDLPAIVNDYHARGIAVTTDVMYVLPGESFEDAMDTMRKCFGIGFDYLAYRRTLMLPGCEMETAESRKKFGLKTKFLIHSGSYGEYSSKNEPLRAVELDEAIVGSSRFSEQDALTFHVLTWLVFYAWNHARLRPLIKYLMDKYNINAADFLLKILKCDKQAFPYFGAFINNLHKDLAITMFNTPEEMYEYYAKEENWQSLIKFFKVELRCNALLYSERVLFEDLCKVIEHSVGALKYDKTLMDILNYTKEGFVDLHKIAEKKSLSEKNLEIVADALSYITSDKEYEFNSGGIYNIKLFKSPSEQSKTRDILLNNGYSSNPVFAVACLLDISYASCVYDYEILPQESNTMISPIEGEYGN
jgi:radical SAM superfamily enzyme YgiQ (UPF0313 family)